MDAKEQIIKSVENFLKKAFCISGEAKFEKFIKVEGKAGGMFKLKDEERGEFYIAILNNEMISQLIK